MSDSDDVIRPEDALKTIDQVLVADPRNTNWQLSDWHARLAAIELVESTPTTVKQLFENAKNIALYAHFAYRLHQPAETIAFVALEKALKMKFERESSRLALTRQPKNLADYMDIALEQGWITDEGYTSSRPTARSRVEQRTIQALIREDGAAVGEAVPIPEPEPSEIDAELRAMGVARTRLHAGRRVRNFLAHGEGGLAPSSVGTLRAVAEEINQLFSDEEQ